MSEIETIVARYEVCTHCAEERAAGDLPKCHFCDGKGMRRLAETYRCNLCAGPLCPAPPDINDRVPHGLVETTYQGSYSSEHLTDGTSYTFSLCERCLRTLFTSFKIPPVTIGMNEDGYAKDLANYEDWMWRRSKGHLERLHEGRCNADRACLERATWRAFHSGAISTTVCCDAHLEEGRFNNTWEQVVPFVETAAVVTEHPNHSEKDHRIALSAWMGSFLRKAMATGDLGTPTWPTYWPWSPSTHLTALARQIGTLNEVAVLFVPSGVQPPSWLGEGGASNPHALPLEGHLHLPKTESGWFPGGDFFIGQFTPPKDAPVHQPVRDGYRALKERLR